MPKVKSHSGTAKRVKQTGTGLFKIKRTGMRHGLRKKETTQKRHLNVDKILRGGNDRAVRRAMRQPLPKRKYILIPLDPAEFEALQQQAAQSKA